MPCIFCTSDLHEHGKCPMFGKTEEYLKAHAPTVSLEGPVNKPRSSFASTQLEQLYGSDHESVLSDAMDDPDLSSDQRTLAMEILSGQKDIKKLDVSDREMINEITTHTYGSASVASRKSAVQAARAVKAEPMSFLQDPELEMDYQIEDLKPYSPK